jgi:hypothetical protein
MKKIKMLKPWRRKHQTFLRAIRGIEILNKHLEQLTVKGERVGRIYIEIYFDDLGVTAGNIDVETSKTEDP